MLKQTIILAISLVAVFPVIAVAYEGGTNQTLTFLAAKKFNQCTANTDIPKLTPLQVRYIAKTNVGMASRNLFLRVFNWRYYDRGAQEGKSFLWVLDTRFNKHFNEAEKKLLGSEDLKTKYSNLGLLISYIQVVTSPAHAIPVYASRFWRFNSSDRFDRFPVDQELLESLLDCKALSRFSANSYSHIVQSVSRETIEAVDSPINGLPTTWKSFWQLPDNNSDFGSYGPAGNNFGRKTEFACDLNTECVLLRDDPLYREFALSRHLLAIEGSMQAMLLMQLSLIGELE